MPGLIQQHWLSPMGSNAVRLAKAAPKCGQAIFSNPAGPAALALCALAGIDRYPGAQKSGLTSGLPRVVDRPRCSSGPSAAKLPVLSQLGEISLAELLVTPPENECQHDRTSLLRPWIKALRFRTASRGVGIGCVCYTPKGR
jgi:hypothetical protein